MATDYDVSDSIDPVFQDGNDITHRRLNTIAFHPKLADYRKGGVTVTADWAANTIDVDPGVAVLAGPSFEAYTVRIETQIQDLTLEDSNGLNYVHLYVDYDESVTPSYGIHIDTDQTSKVGAENLLIAEVDTSTENVSQRNTTDDTGSGGGGGGGSISMEGGDGPTGPNQHTEFKPTSGEEEFARVSLDTGQDATLWKASLLQKGEHSSTASDSSLVMRFYEDGSSQLGPDIAANDARTWSSDPPVSATGVDIVVVYENTTSDPIQATADWTFENSS